MPYYKVRRVLKGESTMSMATMTSKGQVTIPAVVRAALGVESGDRIEFVQIENGRFELVASTHSVTALKGLVRKPAKPVTIEAMNQTIATQGAKAR
jgi:AbrB family looped-hinge helix DNA binding protein